MGGRVAAVMPGATVSNPFDQVLSAVQNTEPSQAWLGVLAALALYGAKRLIDATLPRGYVFRFMERFLSKNNGKGKSGR